MRESLAVVETHRLLGRGLGYVDVHPLAAAMMDRTSRWGLDRRLAAEATRLGIAA